jgi:hypothetical protein
MARVAVKMFRQSPYQEHDDEKVESIHRPANEASSDGVPSV